MASKFSKTILVFSNFILFLSVSGYFRGSAADVTPYCVKPVNATILPKCEISFFEVGTYGRGINGTCLDYNVFVVKPNRTAPTYRSRTAADYTYFSSIYDDELPLYGRIVCKSNFSVDFDFEGTGAVDFSQIWKGHWDKTRTTSAQVLLTPEATGKYTFYSTANPENRVSFFLFSERGSRPYMVGGSRILSGVKVNETTTIIPCVASDQIANVTLYKKINEVWVKVNSSVPDVPIPYDPQSGFLLNSTDASGGDYRCFADDGNGNLLNTDYVTVHVKSEAEEQSPAQPKPEILTIEIRNKTAYCYTTENRTDLKFSNVNGRNPTELRLLEQCLRRKNQYCGSHSYHSKKDGRTPQYTSCPNNSTSCLIITDAHNMGLFYCETTDGENTVMQEYFTGLDGNIYTNISQAATNVLLRPTWTPNGTALQTSTPYDFLCSSAGFNFLGNPFTLSIKYKNGSIVKLHEMVSSRRLFLTTDMDEIICEDHVWTTNELITSGVKISVTPKRCEFSQFACKNGQCIREAWQCDGDRDCADGSDEENCHSHHCKNGNFKCNDGRCILSSKKCNNIVECLDGSDETIETCNSTYCSSYSSFKCTTGQCVPTYNICDGTKNCLDGSDEAEALCSKYHPHFNSTKTDVTFTPNSMNELVCKLNPYLLERFKPTISWWRRGENITDPDRLCQGMTGLKLSLRFENVTADDNGEFICIATNKLKKATQVFQVTVRHPISQSTTTNSPLTSRDGGGGGGADSRPQSTQESKEGVCSCSNESSPGILGIILMILGVIAVFAVIGLGARYVIMKRRNVAPPGSVRMQDDQSIVMNGLY